MARFRQFDTLRSFMVVAECKGFTEAAERLNLTKGAVSQQIKVLETQLGFSLFHRLPRGIQLTEHGYELFASCRGAFGQMEREISRLQARAEHTLVIGVTSYFASRWLAPRLAEFIAAHPRIRMRLQPLVDTSDLEEAGVDLAIRWGYGQWRDVDHELLFSCPAFPTGNSEAWQLVQEKGIELAFTDFRLLRDRATSNAWGQWFEKAQIEWDNDQDTLVVEDPNVRVQAAVSGQGIVLNDVLVQEELDNGKLFRLSDIQLENYGYYLAHRAESIEWPFTRAFVDWMVQTATV